MAQTTPQEEIREVRLAQGTVRYREAGTGEPIVFVHGLLVDGSLWRDVVERLRTGFRCIVPDLPLGSHLQPMDAGADLTPPGLARVLADLLEALDLERVTVVANDTGGAIAQVYATRHPERLGRLVLTNCDAFENFLPPAFRPLQWIARVPGLPAALMQPLRLGAIRRSPLGYGLLAKRLDAERLEAWARPSIESRGVRRDAVKVLRGISTRHTLEAAERLRQLDRPALLAWARGDRFFKPKFAERLAEAIPGCRLEWVEDSRAFVPVDQPERLAELVAGFAREPAAA